MTTPRPELEATIELFLDGGAKLLVPTATFADMADRVLGVVLDWDGVFHSGRSRDGQGGFAEPDSMGLNLLRYGLWRRLGPRPQTGDLPIVVLVSGRADPAMLRFADREHFTAVYADVRDKALAVADISARYAIAPQRLAAVFDDVNDLPLAAACGLGFQVRRQASPLFARYVNAHGLAHFVTGSGPNDCAVREICELLLGVLGQYDAVVSSRDAFDANYAAYWSARNATATERPLAQCAGQK